MLETLFTQHKTLERIKLPWLRQSIDDFLCDRATLCFKEATLLGYASSLLHFAEFLGDLGVRQGEPFASWVEPFVARFPGPERRTRVRNVLHRFSRFCHPELAFHVDQPSDDAEPWTPLLQEYAAFLVEHRGLCPRSIRHIRWNCSAFLAFLAAEGCSDPGRLKPELIHRCLIAAGKRYSRVTMRSHCCAVRRFLAHLYRRGVLAVDLSWAVVSPRVYRHEQCPRFLTHPEVEAVLGVIDRQTPVGRRDYAMLLLLASYGLRGCEVLHLRLDDIDWRNDRIRIANRKAGNSTLYPLSTSVGEAVVEYLRNGRHAAADREVFLTVVAPFGRLASTETLARQARKYMSLAGVSVAHAGTHSFRYSCAQRLFETGSPLKVIGDFLGHTHPDSTLRYTKIDIERLREVALGDGEESL